MSRSAPTARSPGRPARSAFVQAKELRTFEAPSTVGGLAFLPKGFRLAIAHYNGATLWFPNAPQAQPEKLEWKGSHLGVTVQSRRPLPGHHHAGADAARLAAGRRQAHAHVRLCGARHLVRLDHRRTFPRHVGRPTSSSSGRSRPRKARWASSRGFLRRPSIASRPSPAIPSRTSSPPATPTAWCFWCASTTAPKSWRKSPATRRSRRWPGAPTARLLAFGTESGEAGIVDLA